MSKGDARLGYSKRFVNASLEARILRRWSWAGLGIALALIAVSRGREAAVLAQSSCGQTVNPIECENQKPGAPSSEWDIGNAGDPSIQGFATEISVVPGQVERFKIDTNASSYAIDIYRMGYYGGMGARKVASITPSASLPQSINPVDGLVRQAGCDCGSEADGVIDATFLAPIPP